MNTWNLSFSRMRSLACLAIVVLHTCSYSLVSAGARGAGVTDGQSMGATLGQFTFMWAVPVFVMVTGALLLDPARSIPWDKLWKKYIARIGGALLAFGLLFLVLDLVLNGAAETLGNSSFYATHPKAGAGYGYAVICGIVDLLTGHSWAHMWYLYMLLGLYLLVPFYKKVIGNSYEDELRGLTLIFFVFLCIVPLLGLAGIFTDYRFTVATIYPFFLLAGYVLHEKIIEVPKWLAWALLVVSTGCIWLSVYFLKEDHMTELSYLTSYNSLPVLLQACSIFVLLDRADDVMDDSPTTMQKLLLSFDKCSFGIYLIHFIFVKVAFRYLGLDPFAHGWLFPVVILVVTGISWGLTWLLQKVPGVKKII